MNWVRYIRRRMAIPANQAPLKRFLLLILLSGFGFPSEAQTRPPARTPEELKHLLKHDCGSCHGLTLKGGLGSDLTQERVRKASVEELQEVILSGRAGTAMPAWRGVLNSEEARQLALLLKEGVNEN